MGRPRKVPVVTPEVTPEFNLEAIPVVEVATIETAPVVEVVTIEAAPVVVDEFAGLSPQTVAEIKAGREALARYAALHVKD